MSASNEHLINIRMFARECNYVWPERLWTGVAFYNGTRITVEEFNKQVAIFKGTTI